MSYDYEQIANEFAGPDARDAVRAVAEMLHYNESMHMHDSVGEKEPCSYCWLRAGRAVKAMRQLDAGNAAASDTAVQR